MAAEDSVHAPLLACSESSELQRARSACVLHDECFLSVGKAKSSEASSRIQRKLWIATSLAFIFMIAEVIGGYLASSVAIMSDAAHMLSDVSAFLVAIFAAWAATQRSTWHYSFGYHRVEILGALISVLIIWMLSGALVVEAVQRVINPVRVDGKLMFIIASAGIVFNIVMALTLGVHAHHGHSHGECGDHGHSHSHSHSHSGSHSHGSGSSHGHSAGGSSSSKPKKQQQQNGSHGHSHGHAGHGHSHSHSKQADVGHGQGGCSGHGHAHDHSHDHGHDHSSSSSSSSEHGVSGHGHQHQHGSGGCQGHDHEHGHHHHDHQHSGGCTAHAAAQQQQQPAGDGEAVVVDMGAAVGAAAGEAASASCTSIDIEVRCAVPGGEKPCRSPDHSHSHAHGADEDDHHDHHHDHHGHDHDNINLRGAVLHVIGDLVQSMGVALAGALIWYNQEDPRWYIADPICTFVFSILVLLTTSQVLRDIIQVLMERTPRSMDVPELMEAMREVEGIEDVHDLHVWNISTGIPVLTAHVHVAHAADHSSILLQLERSFQRRGIKHSTVQICNPVPGGQV